MSRKHFAISTLSLAVALSLAGSDALALGVGGLRVQSALDQPFVGEIELLDVKPDELDSVKAQIAGTEDFRKVGAERYHYLTKLRFSPQISPRGKTVLRVSSREPIREPYMDFLLEVQWPNGRVVKEYTVLLDPPATAGRSAPRIEQPVAQARSAPAVSEAPPRPAKPPVERPRKIAQSPPPDSAPRAIPVAVSGNGFPKYVGPVRSGTGLWRLAMRNTPQSATVAQTAMALYRNNQGAFVNGNINRLSVGKTLIIPSAAELFALEPETAQREFEAALRGEKVQRAPIAPASIPGSPDDRSRLKIAGASPGDKAANGAVAQGPGGMEQELLLVREASESTRQETLEMRGRIRELETQLSEIQRLLQLRNAELARIQKGVPGPGEIAAVDSSAPSGPTVGARTGLEGAIQAPGGVPPEGPSLSATEGSTSSPEPLPTTLPPDESVPAPDAATATGPEQLPSTGGPAAEVGATASPPQSPDNSQTPVIVSQTSPEGAPTTKPARPSVVDAAPADAGAGDSTWRALLLPLAGIAGVTALGIGALTWWRSRRRREDVFDDELDVGSLGTQKAESAVFDESEDLHEAETSSSAITPFRRAEPETDETDVISEADIYIAYGRFREAEVLLREEIRGFPSRLDLKLKLAEAFLGAKNRPAIEALLQEMQSLGEGRVPADQLQRLAEMAASIPPAEGATGDFSQGRGSVLQPGGADAASEGRSLVADSFGAVSKEVFSLDISDDSGLSRGRDGGPFAPAPASLGVVRDKVGFAASGAGPRPVEPTPDDLGPLVMDEESFSRHLGFDDDSDDLGEGLAPPPASGADRPGSERRRTDDSRNSAPGVSDLELNIEDLWAARDVDLESFVDAAPTGPEGSEPNLGYFEPPPGRGQPTPLRPVSTEVSGGQRPSAMTGLFGGQEESASSDLLTSQWQMDSGLWDETATKLDLARAYIEMGDKESAKGILEEVAGEGTDEQRAEASELLRRVV